MDIYGLNLSTGIEKAKFDELLKFVNIEKQVKINRFRRYEDAQRSLFAELLLRNVLCLKLNIPNESIAFGQNEYGKPFISNFTGVHFNLSHSHDWVVCAVSDMPVGIDIEVVKPIDLDIAKRFFSAGEYENLVSKKEHERVQSFFEYWTLKESYIKAWGRGLSAPLNSFTIKTNFPEIKVLTDNEYSRCFFRQYNIDNSYKMAVCSEKEDFPEGVLIKSIEEIYEFFVLY